MNAGAWSIAVNVLAIIIFLLCTLAVAMAAGFTVWSLRRIDRTLAPAMTVLVEIHKPLIKMVETLDNVGTVASELKDLKEGDLRIIQAQVKSVNELRQVIEEFHAALFAGPEKVQRRRPLATGGATEQDEMLAEQRAAQGNGNRTAQELQDILENRGKHGGVV